MLLHELFIKKGILSETSLYHHQGTRTYLCATMIDDDQGRKPLLDTTKSFNMLSTSVLRLDVMEKSCIGPTTQFDKILDPEKVVWLER